MHLYLRRLRLGLFLLLAVTISSFGCLGGGKGNVSGKVTYKSGPMPGGYVHFHHATSKSIVSATINPADGTYTAQGVPTGLNKVRVQAIEEVKSGGFGGGRPGGAGNAGGPPKDKGGPPPGVTLPPGMDAKAFDRQSPGKAVKLADIYNDAEKSGLSLTVKSGNNPYDIEVK